MNAATAPPIAAATTVGNVSLIVADLARSRDFYESVLGLSARPSGDDRELQLSAAGGPALVTLREDAGAPPLDLRAPGLFHLALLTPSRLELARSLARLAAARWPLTGASEHLVSEALYLRDPDGNGIEIYRDRPRTEWATDEHGQLQMATLPLDLQGLAAELDSDRPPLGGLTEGTRMGHVHLQVSDIAAAEAFYSGVLGFEVTVRTYPGALFVSAGGYHHHIGLNTWNSAGSPPPPPAGAAGLRHFEVQLPERAELERILSRASAAGLGAETTSGGALLRDPSGNGVLLHCR